MLVISFVVYRDRIINFCSTVLSFQLVLKLCYSHRGHFICLHAVSYNRHCSVILMFQGLTTTYFHHSELRTVQT